MITRLLRLAAAIVVFTPVTAAGAQMVDQFNNVGTGNFNGTAHGYSSLASTIGGSGQTFVNSQNNSAGAGLYLANKGTLQADGTLNVSLWTGLPGSGGTLLASGSVNYSLAVNAEGMFDAFWSSPVSLAQAQHFLMFTSDLNVTQTTSNADVTAYYGSNPYFGGVAWVDGNGSAPGANYHPFPMLDLRFEELYVAPEPASLALMATALTVVGVATRRRK